MLILLKGTGLQASKIQTLLRRGGGLEVQIYAKYISPYDDPTISDGRTPPKPIRFIRFDNTKHRNIFGSFSRGVDISDKVKLHVPSNKSDDYHTEEIDEFLSEFRVYKEEGGTA